jgi:hypothetical protein
LGDFSGNAREFLIICTKTSKYLNIYYKKRPTFLYLALRAWRIFLACLIICIESFHVWNLISNFFSILDSNHYGIAGWYSRKAMQQDLIVNHSLIITIN